MGQVALVPIRGSHVREGEREVEADFTVLDPGKDGGISLELGNQALGDACELRHPRTGVGHRAIAQGAGRAL